MTKPRRKLTPEERAQRIEKYLLDYLEVGAQVGTLCAHREALLKRARRAGLKLHQPIAVAGIEYELRKPEGKYVHFNEVELKKVPQFKRGTPRKGSQASQPDSAGSASSLPTPATPAEATA